MRFLAILFFLAFTSCALKEKEPEQQKFAIAIHGGAGTLRPENFTDSLKNLYLAKLEEAVKAGYDILKTGGRAEDAVIASINLLEDSPLFNAGRGSVLTNQGTIEMDAAIMLGDSLRAGAVAGIKYIKNPIKAAKLVLTESPHVLLTGEGAIEFCVENGLETKDSAYFYVTRRVEQLKNKKSRDNKFGTVGCVALDQYGNLVAGTSTGGMTNKKFGRVGDVPVIGAGTYANNNSCAVSATGHGEYFIRNVVAHDISSRMLYLNESLEEAANHLMFEVLKPQGGGGGVIAIDKEGNISMPFNTTGMYRASIDIHGNLQVAIFKD
mgnify:CR=1 FL=1